MPEQLLPPRPHGGTMAPGHDAEGPGLVMRRRLLELLRKHGEEEVTQTDA